jgi:hypothetical protein
MNQPLIGLESVGFTMYGVWYHERLDVLADFFCTPTSQYAFWLTKTGWVYVGDL